MTTAQLMALWGLLVANYALAAAIASHNPARGWRWLKILFTVNAGVAVVLAVARFAGGDMPDWLSPSPASNVMLILVTFLGAILAAFSHQYLKTEAHPGYYQRWLSVSLIGVVVVVTSYHLLSLLVGWVLISLAFHRLMLFYPDRPRAVLAAHKKFIFARLAELCLLLAIALLYLEHGTFSIGTILAAYGEGGPGLSTLDQAAALLIATTALVKCAQLPLHGWLIQVVESPTTVSALLHAGIINLGGYVLMLFAPLLAGSAVAQWWLLLVAGPSCVVAALVMQTRVSEKVRLAWSTSSQMGLMLVECALGLYELALLHLVGHSCYKAYAFLSAGERVSGWVSERMAPAAPARRPALVSLLALALVAVVAALWAPAMLASPAALGLALLALGLAVPLAQRTLPVAAVAAAAVVLTLAYLLQKTFVGYLLADPGQSVSVWALAWVALLFAVLARLYWRLSREPAAASALHRNLYAGFYLDEWSTRLTLALWPIDLPRRRAPAPVPALSQREALL